MALIDSIIRNNWKEVRRALRNDPEPFEVNEGLVLAVSMNAKPRIVKTLLWNGGDPNALDEEGSSLLHLAIKRNNLEVVKVLIRSKTRLDPVLHAIPASRRSSSFLEAIDPDGNRPIHLAVEKNNWEIVNALIKAGVSLEVRGPLGTPMELAIKLGHYHVARVLSDWGITTAASDVYQLDREFRVRADEPWADSQPSTSSDPPIDTSLHQAAAFGNLEVVKALIEAGFSVNTQDQIGRIPLHESITNGHHEVTWFLLSSPDQAHETKVNTVDRTGRTPLHEAISRGDHDTIRLLLACGVDPNLHGSQSKAPIQEALDRNDTVMAMELWHAGASSDHDRVVDWVDPKSSTEKSEPDKPKEKDRGDCSKPKKRPVPKGRPARSLGVISSSKYGVRDLHQSIRSGSTDRVRMLLRKGVDPKIPDKKGRTALMIAIEHGEETIIEDLKRAEERSVA